MFKNCKTMKQFEEVVNRLRAIIPSVFRKYGALDLSDEAIENAAKNFRGSRSFADHFIDVVKFMRDMGLIDVAYINISNNATKKKAYKQLYFELKSVHVEAEIMKAIEVNYKAGDSVEQLISKSSLYLANTRSSNHD